MVINSPTKALDSIGPVGELAQPVSPVSQRGVEQPLQTLLSSDIGRREGVDGGTLVVAKRGEDDLSRQELLHEIHHVLHYGQLYTGKGGRVGNFQRC